LSCAPGGRGRPPALFRFQSQRLGPSTSSPCSTPALTGGDSAGPPANPPLLRRPTPARSTRLPTRSTSDESPAEFREPGQVAWPPSAMRGHRWQCAEAPAGRRSVTLQCSGRGGGQARPWQCLGCCAALVADRPRRRLPGELPDAIPAVGVVAVAGNARMSAMPAGTGARPSWVSTHPVASSVVRVGCPAVRCPGNWLHRPGSGRPAVWCLPVRDPAVRCPPVRPVASVSSRVRRRRWGPGRYSGAAVTTATGRAACGLPRPRTARSTAAEAWTRAPLPGSCVGQRGVGRRPGRIVLRLGRRLRSTAAPTGQGGQPTVRAPVAGGCARAGERAAARRCCTCRVAVVLGWLRDYGGWSLWRLAPGVDGPAGPPSLPARMGVRPQRGPGVQRVLPVRRRHRCDLQEWWWARQGLNL
jgi:hypothetical protein